MIERIRRAGQVSWAVLGATAVVGVLLFIAWIFRVVFPPLVFAGAIVFILNPVVSWLAGRHLPRALGTALAYLGVAGVLTLAGFLVASPFARQADQLTDEWPELRQQIYDGVDDWAERSREGSWPLRIPTVAELEDEFGGGGRSLAEELDRVRAIGLTVFRVAIVLVLGPIIAFYFLVDLPHLRRVADSLVPRRMKPDAMLIARRLNQAIGGFFRGQLAVAFIVGTMVSIGLLILGLPFWLLVGMIAGVFNMVPLIGPWIGAIPGVVIALTTRDLGTAIWVAVIMAGVQQIDNHLITPNVMQRTVKLHPAAVMLALLAGGTLGGFFGLLLAVPVTAVIKIIGSYLWHSYVLGEPIEATEALPSDDWGDGSGAATPERVDDLQPN